MRTPADNHKRTGTSDDLHAGESAAQRPGCHMPRLDICLLNMQCDGVLRW